MSYVNQKSKMTHSTYLNEVNYVCYIKLLRRCDEYIFKKHTHDFLTRYDNRFLIPPIPPSDFVFHHGCRGSCITLKHRGAVCVCVCVLANSNGDGGG